MKTAPLFRPADPAPPQSDALNAMMGKVITDLGAAANGALVVLGDRLGLYRALAEAGPSTSAELATCTGLNERYVREWLAAQAASGYVDYDVTDAFRTGAGSPLGDHHSCLFCGTERCFRPGYVANLVDHWIPALDGVQEKLRAGARVADIGCGHGVSTIVMAKAYPNSQFTGFDMHEASIEAARQHAADEGVNNVRFEVAAAKTFPGKDYGFVTVFDALHDMGDPAGMAAHVLECLKPDGTWMIVEPMAGDSLAENLNPIGRAFYAFSTMICTPNSKSQEVGLALGAQAGERRLGEVVKQGGFTRFRRATETPVNLILEARP